MWYNVVCSEYEIWKRSNGYFSHESVREENFSVAFQLFILLIAYFIVFISALFPIYIFTLRRRSRQQIVVAAFLPVSVGSLLVSVVVHGSVILKTTAKIFWFLWKNYANQKHC